MEINAISGEFYRVRIPEYQSGRISPFWIISSVDACAKFVEDTNQKHHGHFLRLHGKEIDNYLAGRGLLLDQETRASLDYAVAKAILQAEEQASKFVSGDFRPDPLADRFAKLPDKPVEHVLPLDEWFQKYADASKLAPSTRKRWRPALETLVISVGHDDLARITADDVAGWVDGLAEDGRGDKTIRDVYLASAKALFGWLKDSKRKIGSNPCTGIRVKVVEGPVLRDRFFTETEASTILAAALVPQDQRLSPEHAAARRWVPWVCAYTGARVGEITQLRRQDFREEGDVPVFRITPDAGTVKTKRFRDVPLHPHLVEMGFLDYVATRSDALFFNPARGRGGSAANPISKKVGERLAAWVRGLGITDVGVDPNHGWRHGFKTRGRRGGMRDSVLDAIQGHVPKTEGGKYGGFPVDVLAQEMRLFPRYVVPPAASAAIAA